MQSYSPYGEVTSSIGDFETNYNFTGEWTDGTGLVNLRARTYDPATGRFVSRDTWGGDYQNPLSLNKWNYVEGNPINRIDPTGLYFWGPGDALFESSKNRFQNQNIHLRIQELWMLNRQSIIHAEYLIPGTGYPVDLLNSITGEIWEIKPFNDIEQASVDLNIRVLGMNFTKGDLAGMTPVATKYDWRFNPLVWREGTSFPSEIFLGTDTSGFFSFYAGQVKPGVILWWKVFNPQRVPVIVPIKVPDKVTWSQRNRRPNWQPSPGLAPGLVPAFEVNPFSTLSRSILNNPSMISQGEIKSIIYSGLIIGGSGTLFWWLGKIFSPICGPFAPVCFVCL